MSSIPKPRRPRSSPYLAMTLLLAMVISSATHAEGIDSLRLHSWRLALAVQSSMRTEDVGSVPQQSVPGLKSEQKAFNYSLIGTLAPIPTLALTVPGIWFGPSLGYFYADCPGRAWTGIGIRTLALGGMISAFGICGWDCGRGDTEYNIAWALFLTSGGAFVGSAVYDIATVKATVRRQNQLRHATSWSIRPTYRPDRAMPGLQLVRRFR